MSQSVLYSDTIEEVTCGNCGIIFGLPSGFKTSRLKDGGRFYCPNGHYIGWDSQDDKEAQRLRERAERAERRAASAEGRAERIERSRRAIKGQLTKTRKRIAHGVCPCCQRTFENLARHMASKHPEMILTVKRRGGSWYDVVRGDGSRACGPVRGRDAAHEKMAELLGQRPGDTP